MTGSAAGQSVERVEDRNLQGFDLNSLGRAVGQSSSPAVGSECGEGPSVYPQVWTSVEEDRQEDRSYVAYRSLRVLLWPESAPDIGREPVDEWGAIPPPVNATRRGQAVAICARRR